MKISYHDDARQCSVADGKPTDLDSVAAKYLCPYCGGGITVQRIEKGPYRLWCPKCGELHAVASRYAGRSSRVIVMNEPTKKSREDLYG